ncbi:MAG: bacillithiol system protein YtxJ [Vicingaceae bacterium]|jgi:bacillithiol system protein YtxJ
MGLFSLGSKKVDSIKWVHFNDANQLPTLIEESKHKPVLFFKHSTRCSISSMAKSRLESDWDLDEEVMPVYLDLISYRSLSALVAEKFGVQHESPQIILVKDGMATYDASHSQISVNDIKKSL